MGQKRDVVTTGVRESTLVEVRRAVTFVAEEHRKNERVLRQAATSPGLREALARAMPVRPETAQTGLRRPAVALAANLLPPDAAGRKHPLREGVEAFIHALNEESEAGYRHATALLQRGAAEWDAMLAEHPHWLREGTFDCLVREARERVDAGDAASAHEITAFVLRYVDRIPIPLHGKEIVDTLAGRAWLVHAAALFAIAQGEAALAAADAAERLYATSPLQPLYRAEVQLLRARIWEADGRASDALLLLSACARTFVRHADNAHLVRALGAIAEILCAAHRPVDAHEVIGCAREVVGQNGQEALTGILKEALEHCAAYAAAVDSGAIQFLGDWTMSAPGEDDH